nr:maleylpyruvate isomerase family mycothiol-dependent enzyme [Acidipropionibacterium jensenii]
MTSDSTRTSALHISAGTDEIRAAKLEATQRLLGSTMGISEEQWQSPSRLPGWTRAHVATHLARNADAFTRVVSGLAEDRQVPMYDSRAERDQEIERGSERDGLALQIDLDTSAGRLHEAFNLLEALPPMTTVELAPGLEVDSGQLPTARLAEVLLHHLDLDVGFSLSDISPDAAGWLLAWVCFRLRGRSTIPAMRILSDTGLTDRIGGSGYAPTVRGSDAALAGWLSGRTGPEELRGVQNLAIPLLG